MRSALLGRAALIAPLALVAEQPSAIVELNDVCRHHVGGVRDALELADLYGHEPRLAVPLKAAHRLRRVTGQVLYRALRGEREIAGRHTPIGGTVVGGLCHF